MVGIPGVELTTLSARVGLGEVPQTKPLAVMVALPSNTVCPIHTADIWVMENTESVTTIGSCGTVSKRMSMSSNTNWKTSEQLWWRKAIHTVCPA